MTLSPLPLFVNLNEREVKQTRKVSRLVLLTCTQYLPARDNSASHSELLGARVVKHAGDAFGWHIGTVLNTSTYTQTLDRHAGANNYYTLTSRTSLDNLLSSTTNYNRNPISQTTSKRLTSPLLPIVSHKHPH